MTLMSKFQGNERSCTLIVQDNFLFLCNCLAASDLKRDSHVYELRHIYEKVHYSKEVNTILYSMRACHAVGPGSIPGQDKFPG